MTGNSTRFAVGAAEVRQAALIAGGLIALFVTGVVVGSLLAARAGSRRTPAVLSLVAILLVVAAPIRLGGGEWPAIACLALAMGLVNAALEGKDGAVVGVTYMTGTLVQMGQKIANRLRGQGTGAGFITSDCGPRLSVARSLARARFCGRFRSPMAWPPCWPADWFSMRCARGGGRPKPALPSRRGGSTRGQAIK